MQQEESEDESGRITIGLQTGGTEVSLLNKDGSRRVLSGLADGDLSEGSTEAVTGSQLFKVDSDLKATKDTVTEISTTVDGLSTSMTAVQGDVSKIAKNTSKYLGGGANILDRTAPTYQVQGKDYQNVGSAFAGVDDSLSDIYQELSGVGSKSLVQQEASEDGNGRITIGSQVGGTEISLANKDGEGRTLSGLKDGALSATSNEAVTGKQLYEVESKVTETSGKVEGLSTSMTAVQGDVSKIAKNASEYLGGGANVLDGTAPTYQVQGKDYQNVGTAFTGVDGSITDIYSKIASVAGGSLVEQEASEDGSGRITVGSKVAGAEINFSNKDDEGRVLSGIKDGIVSRGSNQAVTGNQLYTTNSQIAQYLGGGARYEDGQWIDPTFTLNVVQEDGSTQEKEYKNVADALKDVSTSFTNVENVFENGIVQQEESEDESGRITIGAKVGGTEISLANKDGEGRILSGLKDGALSATSNEAVTGKQLYEVDSKFTASVDELSTSMTAVQGDVSKIAENASQYLGGGADVFEGTAPIYQVQGEDYRNVGEAFASVDGSLSDIYQELSGVGSKSLVQQEASENGDGRITIGLQTGGTEVSLLNKDGSRRVLSGLADGDLSEGSTEAVTGSQLFKVDSDLKATKDTVTEISTTVDGLSSGLTEVKTHVTQVEGDLKGVTANVSKITENSSRYLGGGANILEGQAPTYKVQGSQHNDVGSAFVGIDAALTDIYKELSGEGGSEGVGLVQQDTGTGHITIGSKAEGTEINISNKDGDGRILSGLSDGKIVTGSREAVTGSQLYETNSKVASYLGGGAEYKEGVWIDPTFTLNVVQEDGSTQEQEYKNVADALKDVSTSFTNIENVFENGIVQQEESEDESGRITIGLQTGGTEVSLLNKDGSRRVLSGLADGDLSEGSTEAVTGSQLFKVDSDLKATKDTVTEISTTVDGLSTSMTAVQGDVSKIAKNTSKYLGGGANILDRTAPTYQVQGKDYQNVGSAFAGVDDSLSDIYQELSGVGSKSLVQQEASENGDGRITIGAQVGGTEISLANKDGEGRTLSGLKDGALSATSNEAVTGKQLYEVDSKFTASVDELSTSMTAVQGDVSKIAENASQYLGGGADIFEGTAPIYQVQGKDYQNVGSAFAGVDDSLSDIYQELSGVGSKSLVQQEASENGDGRITIGAQVGGTEISLTNKDGEGRTLSGLKDGALSATSNEAVTGKQLYEVDSKFTASVDELSTSMTAVQGDVSKIAENASQYLGGGADVFHGTAPTYQVQGEDYRNVGEAFASVDGSLSDIYQELSGVGSKSLVQQEASENGDGRITIGAKVGGTEISLANKDGEGRILSGLKDGALSATSNEAVTGKQLYEVDSKFTASVDELSTSMTAVQGDVSKIAENASQYLGGGADVFHGTAPTYQVQGEDYRNVGEAFASVDGSLSDIYQELSGVGSKSLVQQEASENGDGRITIGAKVGGTEISLANKDGEGRILSGLKDGALSATSNEAVTGKQLYEVDSKFTASVDELSTSMTAVQGDVSKIAENASQYLGGGADVFHGTAPTYQVQGEFYNTVGSTFAGIDRTLTQLLNDTSENSENLQNSLLWDEEEGAFVALHGEKGKEKVKSKLKFLIDGDIAEGSTEAVTGSQLYETNTKLAEYFGGGAKYGANGWTAPKFEVVQLNSGSKSGQKNYNKYDTVAGAFGGVNDNMEDLNDRLNKVKEQTEQIEQNGLQWNQSKGAYDASRKDKEGNSDSSRITGVKDGEISKGSSDVVTGNQLWETNNKVDDLKNDVNNLKDKVDDFENSVGQMAEGAVQYDKDSEGKKTNKITLAGGDASAPVIIDNVGDGKVEKDSKEAINGGQLYEKMGIVLDEAKKHTDEQMKQAVSEAKDYTDMKFDSLNYNIEGVKSEARQAAAIGLAAANLRYEDAPGALSVAFSSGSWRSQSAIAFGAGYTSESGNIRSNLSVTTAGGHWGIGAGISVRLK
ncbi:YadA-like C-terminal region [Bartonella sp. AR 15-3]|nr:YadA-like C-terminal region [Bartonella sp. AR 15-3]